MAVRRIHQLGDEILRTPCAPVAWPAAGELRALITDLSETLAAFRESAGFGRGIAAPQIGVLSRVLFIRMQPDGFAGALCNPRIQWSSPERMDLWDDCFSFPELMVQVERAERVRVEYQDEKGVWQTLAAAGPLSELLQHEIDHLDGIVAVDRAVSSRALATRTEWERRLRG